jgi:regulator of protease activity HflC (stomatin/prohibitin superfamily)
MKLENGLANPQKLASVMIIFAVFLILAVTFRPFFTVKEVERAVLTRFGQYIGTYGPGLHFMIPITDSVRFFRVDVQAVTIEKANTYTIDNQELDATVVVSYRVDPSDVEAIFKNAPDYEQRLYTLVIDRLKATLGQLNIAEIAQKRGDAAQRVFKVVKNDSRRLLNLDVVDVQLVELFYTPTFRQAVDQAAVAKANVERAEQERRRAEVEAERLKIEAAGQAQAEIERSRGTAQSKLIGAESEAQAIKLVGQAQAERIKLEAESLKINTDLVRLRQAEKWNGQLPTHVLGNAVPFINIDNDKAR